MSFIHLESRQIESLDIMADSVDAKQMHFTLDGELDWRNDLVFDGIKRYQFRISYLSN